MLVTWETYSERLGLPGVRLVVGGLLDGEQFRRFTGVDSGDLSAAGRADLVGEMLVEHPERGTVLLALLDEAGGVVPDEDAADEKRLRDELATALEGPAIDAAQLLHRLARPARAALPVPEIRAAAELLAGLAFGEEPGSRPKYVAKVASDRAGLRELEQERRELETRVRHLESQLARALEQAETLEQQLTRRLNELKELRAGEKETREERARLEREVARLGKRVEELNERRAQERTGEVTTALRRLTTEQRRTIAALTKLRDADRVRRESLGEIGKRTLSQADLLDKMIVLHEAEARTVAASQEAILREIAALRGALAHVQNMFYGAREKGARLDFEALLATASEGRRLVRAVAYLVEARETDQSAFIHLLQMKAWEVKRKPLRIRPDRTMKGNWDLEMALDAVATAPHLDVVVLATGDGDFVPLVRQLKLGGVRVEVYGFPRSTAPDLREAADRFVSIARKLLRPLGRRANAAAAEPAPGSAVDNAEPGAGLVEVVEQGPGR
ncbi:MAG: hypothetical protein H6Q01_1165 [Acidobacteria bacterium]|nr:hypothetical protein [Acidobacteriota bacterium]